MYAILYKPNVYPHFPNWKLAFTTKSLTTTTFHKHMNHLKKAGHVDIKILGEIEDVIIKN